MSTTTDISKFLRGLDAGRAKARKAAARGLAQSAAMVVGNSQQYTPVDTGALAASGTFELKDDGGDRVEALVGHNTNYAAAVHENLTARHDVGQAKYLERAMEELAPKIGPFIAKQVKAALEGGA